LSLQTPGIDRGIPLFLCLVRTDLCYHKRTMAWRWIASAILICSIAWGAEYHIKSVRVLPIDSYPSRMTLEGITIAVDPYSTDEKSYTAFDIRDLNSRGYFPVHVLVRNLTTNYVQVRTQSVMLLTKEKQSLYATSSALVIEDIIKAGFVSKLPKMKSHDLSTSTKPGSPLVDFTSKELRNEQIEPGSTINGFLFFYSGDGRKDILAGSILTVPSLLVEGGKKSIGPFAIPLSTDAGAQAGR
jgi:hypothetical protein